MDDNVVTPGLRRRFLVCAVVAGILLPLACEGDLEDFLGEEPVPQPAERTVLSRPVERVARVARVPEGEPEPGSGYAAEWKSLDKRSTPKWFSDAKFGIFIHWGVYSAPAWGPKTDYSEWYLRRLRTKGSATEAFHKRVYGEDFAYEDFAPLFGAELYDPDEWAQLFVRSGARYVVLTSKHHDGYCLWPSKESDGWNAVDNGPGRDLLGELTEAVKKTDVKMGFYYSLYEWYHPLYQTDVDKYVDQHMLPQIKDLVVRYRPHILWADGEWEHPSSTWRSEEFLAWLFNESPVGERVVVNDRWGKETRHLHGGYFTTEYGSGLAAGHPWEECRGMGHSFGYNRNETVFEYRSPRRIIHTLIEIVSRGGNLLLDIGPTADGRIPVIMQERLVQIGEWLDVNDEAIYGTRPWVKTHEQKEFTVRRVDRQIDFDWNRSSMCYTSKGEAVYCISLDRPGKEIVVPNIPGLHPDAAITMLGRTGELPWRHEGGNLIVDLSQIAIDGLPCEWAWVIKIDGGFGRR